jgi:transcriptional regulator with XRE-family HTH domain
MDKRSPSSPAGGIDDSPLWVCLGNRIRLRREQLGIKLIDAATHLAVTLQTYDEYESGQRLIPADRLAQLANLFEVPVFYFFQDMQVERQSTVPLDGPAPAYKVASDEDRVASLVAQFKRLDLQRQLMVLMVARSLAKEVGSD